MVCSRRCIVVTIDGASYDVDVDLSVDTIFQSLRSYLDFLDRCLFDGVYNATFNNISIISRWSVLLAEEIGGPGENHRPIASH
jgi:hypothetical protein